MSLDYYEISRQASGQVSGHAGLEYLKSLCLTAHKILDVGCGEGTRLATLLPKGKFGIGLDPSKTAIRSAKKNNPGHLFQEGVGEKIEFADNSFDLVYSAFALEHCVSPEQFISEMLRVCQPGGNVVILCPNYGSPNRRSPVSVESPINKFAEGIIKDMFPRTGLDWMQVTPKTDYEVIDSDTTWEPYLKSLLDFLKLKHMNIIRYSSLWELESVSSHNLRKHITLFAGRHGLWPFKYWGPQLFVVAEKRI